MARRAKCDWSALQADWLVGNVSQAGLAKKYGITDTAIRHRIKAEGWKRDEGDLYRHKVEIKVQEKAAASVLAELRGAKARKAAEAEVSDLAAEVGAQIVECHRQDAKRARGLVNMLFDHLGMAAKDRDVLTEMAEQANEDGQISDEQLRKLMKALSLSSHSTTVRDLTVALKNLVYIERGAFGLDKTAGKEQQNDGGVHYDVVF